MTSPNNIWSHKASLLTAIIRADYRSKQVRSIKISKKTSVPLPSWITFDHHPSRFLGQKTGRANQVIWQQSSWIFRQPPWPFRLLFLTVRQGFEPCYSNSFLLFLRFSLQSEFRLGFSVCKVLEDLNFAGEPMMNDKFQYQKVVAGSEKFHDPDCFQAFKSMEKLLTLTKGKVGRVFSQTS